MFKQSVSTSLVVGLGVALAACAVKPPTTSAPAPNYQAAAAAAATPPNLRAVCYDAADLGTYRVRSVQQQLAVGVLSCKSADGSRRLTDQYQAFITKFTPDLASNAAELTIQ